jgi:hypothetical protein
VITDGDRQVKASRLARDFSFARLEERLGPYDRTPGVDLSPPDERVAGVARQVQAAEHAEQLDHLRYHADERLVRTKQYVESLQQAQVRARETGRDFDRQLAQFYVRPHDARALFDSAVRTHGVDAAVQHLAEHPAAYGALRPVYRPVLGVFQVADDRDGLARAVRVASAGRGAAVDAEWLRTLILASPEGTRPVEADRSDAYVSALTHAKERLRHSTRRSEWLRDQRQGVSPHYMVSRELVKLAAGLGPREVQLAALCLTAPQAALLAKARQAARDVALGVER